MSINSCIHNNLIEYTKSKSKTHCVNATISRQIMKILDKLNLSPFSEWHYSIIDKEYVFDISKAQKILGWTPKKSNKELGSNVPVTAVQPKTGGAAPAAPPITIFCGVALFKNIEYINA